MKYLVSFILLISSVGFANDVETILGPIAIQNGGREKPFDTFARESLQLLSGKRDFQNKSAVEVVMTMLLIPQHWNETPFIQITRSDVKEAVQLDTKRSLFSPDELMKKTDRLTLIFQAVHEKRKAEEKLNPYDQAVQTLENQLFLYKSIITGSVLKLVPPASGNSWLSIDEAPAELKETFETVVKAFVATIQSGDSQELNKSVNAFVSQARAINPLGYPSETKLAREVHYNHFHPFLKAWIFYLVAALLFLSFMIRNLKMLLTLGWASAITGFLLHLYGFILRIYITERPPVSNMYETVIWVSFGAMVFGMFFAWKLKRPVVVLASSIVCVLCLILADLAPAVLDESLNPLQPVLRSNLWLIVHVLTITLSYAAFFVAFVLGDIGLVWSLKDNPKVQNNIQEIATAIYRCMQVGVVLVAAGTILGGVWADYSWGRFWGWDPKETWALIVLLGYIAILHGRLAGWLKTFGFVASSVVAFLLVIMAWYGVNFVLGAGKHTYGFGGGGVMYVTAFAVAHLIFVAFVATVRHGRLSSG